MLISVIIPVYNGARFIKAALRSIQQQQHDMLEIIVVDDGSTDETAAAVAQSGIETRYVFQQNRGAQHARNVGLQLARGELITFLDADDMWAAPKLRTQLALMPGYDVVVGYSRLLTKDKRPFLFLNLAAGLFRREAFNTIGGFAATLDTADDLDWFFRVRESDLRLFVHNDIVLYHRRHADNMTKCKAQQNQRELLQMLHKSLTRRRIRGQVQQPQFGQFIQGAPCELFGGQNDFGPLSVGSKR